MPVLDALGIDAELLAALDRRSLHLRRALPRAELPGVRRARGAGESAEVADHRAYAPGDDLRRVDWAGYARSDRLSVRLGVAEREATVTLVVDRSRSMEFGQPVTKTQAAVALAAALAWVAVQGGDRVAVAGFGERAVLSGPAVRGRRGAMHAWTTLRALMAMSRAESAALVGVARRLSPGLCVLLSDFLFEDDLSPALAALRGAGQQLLLMQILSPTEVEPELTGDLRLRDAESDAGIDVSATPAVLTAYRNALAAHTARLETLARAHDAVLVRTLTSTPASTVLLADLRRAGVLR
jgi:uncharacterized protein (DUF58 family)